jgi:ribosomal protein S18 acetylase RimI-like enzyme
MRSVVALESLTAEDWTTWRELRLAALRQSPEAFTAQLVDWLGLGDREERWRHRLQLPDSVNLVARVDGRAAGMVSGQLTDDGIAELFSLWVAPSARGRAVGDRLVQAVEEWARRVRATTLRLSVRQDNHHAVGLYARHGFAFAGRLSPTGPAHGVPEVVMVKKLVEPGG